MYIGILGIQGAIQDHEKVIKKLNHTPLWVKTKEQFKSIDALILPGGESTTMIKLLKAFDLWSSLSGYINDGLPVFATCAGMILLSKKIDNYQKQDTLDILDIHVDRNGYGRQIQSFETDLNIPEIGEKEYTAIFIRAPKITEYGDRIRVYASYKNTPVLIAQNNILAAAFHPELTDDLRIHSFFINRFVMNKNN